MPEFKGNIRSKLPKAGTTIFSIMSGLANEVGAINLSQGFPGFPVSEKLISLYHDALRAGHNQYAPMPGIFTLRECIAEKMEDLYSCEYDPEAEITITAGGTQALYTAISALIHEGDEVIVLEPSYDSYVPAIQLAGGIPVHIPLQPPNYFIPWEEIKKLITQKTRMIIINTPQNPTGTILTAKDMLQLEKITDGTDIIILSDEVYEHIIFDGHRHESMAKYPNLASRSFIISSFGKTFHTTGWKVGYCLAPKELMTEFRKVHQFNVFCVNTPMQYGIAEFLKNKSHYNDLGPFYQAKRDTFNKLLEGSRFSFVASPGTYFQLLSYERITKEKDADYAIRLIKENGLASIPISVFYHKPIFDNMLRFCFAKRDETLEKAAAILRSI